MNPIDVLGVHPSGALMRPQDKRDYHYGSPELGLATAPFDWETGYDVEKDLGFLFPTKDQGQSGSCGGQTIAEVEQSFAAAFLSEQSEKSAKGPYSQVFVQGGGSNSRMLGDIAVKQGFFKESLVPSYQNGQPPSEAFMERPQDITAAAKTDAAIEQGYVAYSFPVLSLEAMASAMKAAKGILIGIHGSNNGTWLSNYPAVNQVGDLWAHFMFGGKAEIVNGKKGIWAKQSWGKTVAPSTNAWQFISEDHWNAGRIWDAMVFTFTPKAAPSTYSFQVNLAYGQTSTDVMNLQKDLSHLGLFSVAPTGYYGDITAQVVLKFRAKYGVSSATDPNGHNVGQLTRAKLNSLK